MTDQSTGLERLTEIRARAGAATPGPWHVTEIEGVWMTTGGHPGFEQGPTYYVFEAEQRGDGECGSMLKEDAEFVAHSRADIPYLLDAIHRLQVKLADHAATTTTAEQPAGEDGA